ncbi:MAG: TetR/AcrR family transcriptional regulator [Gammaproteobacteria bacterium]|nr:TetR/AcrR family transcriptional regulator [Gammaproteobacteria bacterium]MCW8988607.1 TetR/AcrR family transcriptional regulator [Gammaproteobacteria bacterium]
MSHVTSKKTPGDTQAQILSATLSLFTGQGYFNTSVHDIARESEVSIGSIYHHFKDKEGVARALYNDMINRMSSELATIKKNHNTAHDRCYAVIELLFIITEQEPDIMEFMLYSKHREFLPNERPVCSSQPFEIMREFVQDGMNSGEIQDMDLMVASTCLFGGAIRMITSSMDGLLKKPLSSYIDDIWICSWRAVAT